MLNPILRAAMSLFLGAGISMSAAASELPPVQITEFGEFGPQPGKAVVAPNTAKGTAAQVMSRKLIRRTDCIVARRGVRLGVLVRHDDPNLSIMPVEIAVTHPPIVGPDGRTRTIDSWPMQLLKEPLYTGWHFEEAYELVPGPYIISVLVDGRVSDQKVFTVVLPGTSCPKTS
ncbi:DUF3859 domain-containing protein [Microvirga flavescens]|uniref:DUF3859 domain-containing protein n=1 Tax=Microvirga flavescens TaxID=2249811 RepID=UPI000DD6BFB3|nr:DUF3859 domain-containing protein [Microvirga flavescens]